MVDAGDSLHKAAYDRPRTDGHPQVILRGRLAVNESSTGLQHRRLRGSVLPAAARHHGPLSAHLRASEDPTSRQTKTGE